MPYACLYRWKLVREEVDQREAEFCLVGMMLAGVASYHEQVCVEVFGGGL